ncbi:hypothetical protein UFOVP1219_28 [uncultured Caudovirales phage]|uniref:Uncharacterized protein n=3 Tax=uncultured Caudovirales phage TaxID=2100421 RepID=A0A6J5T5V2_9CAUD|nr:hypothetical protein UFOVP1219_28 [uncultured Caudovirales phage]CAB4223093.1 hypothetical protein UFOVP1671_3 [uncultured Caudovirales phage]CAB5220510.1 hypothetical protein UFOVP358_30 [uncultured Caudovirales phage]
MSTMNVKHLYINNTLINTLWGASQHKEIVYTLKNTLKDYVRSNEQLANIARDAELEACRIRVALEQGYVVSASLTRLAERLTEELAKSQAHAQMVWALMFVLKNQTSDCPEVKWDDLFAAEWNDDNS